MENIKVRIILSPYENGRFKTHTLNLIVDNYMFKTDDEGKVELHRMINEDILTHEKNYKFIRKIDEKNLNTFFSDHKENGDIVYYGYFEDRKIANREYSSKIKRYLINDFLKNEKCRDDRLRSDIKCLII